MGAAERWGSTPLIVDTCAWIWLPLTPQDIKEDFEDGIRSGLFRSSPIVRMELLRGTANPTEFEAMESRLNVLPELSLPSFADDEAVNAMRRLKDRGSHGYHKVTPGDALVAVTAARNDVNVLHYDKHYPRLAEVLNFDAPWLAQEGTLIRRS